MDLWEKNVVTGNTPGVVFRRLKIVGWHCRKSDAQRGQSEDEANGRRWRKEKEKSGKSDKAALFNNLTPSLLQTRHKIVQRLLTNTWMQRFDFTISSYATTNCWRNYTRNKIIKYLHRYKQYCYYFSKFPSLEGAFNVK